MRNGHLIVKILVAAVAIFSLGIAVAADNKENPFKGKLFAPNEILENQAELGLTKDQFTEIRATVVEVQGNLSEYEWDMREAYLKLMAELDESPISEDRVLEHAEVAMRAENQVKKHQMAMLVRLKNILTAEQIAYLESKHGK